MGRHSVQERSCTERGGSARGHTQSSFEYLQHTQLAQAIPAVLGTSLVLAGEVHRAGLQPCARVPGARYRRGRVLARALALRERGVPGAADEQAQVRRAPALERLDELRPARPLSVRSTLALVRSQAHIFGAPRPGFANPADPQTWLAALFSNGF